jgi:methylated-DNA-[protein]-cysteine S-methyltransferase
MDSFDSADIPVTPFQERVYRALMRVPEGYVTTYALLARAVQCGSARAVGQSLRRNPFAPRVPCHRVIASDLTLGGFAGKRSGAKIAEKRSLLAAEGVTFTNGKLDDSGKVYRYKQ